MVKFKGLITFFSRNAAFSNITAAARSGIIAAVYLLSVFMNESSEIKWQLKCSYKEAIELMIKSIDPPHKPSLFGKSNFKGMVRDNNFEIWSKTPGMRGHRVAICTGQILSTGNNCSELFAQMRILGPFKYISLGWKSLSIIIPLSVIAFLSSVFGSLFADYNYLESVGFPLGILLSLILLIGFGRYLADHDLIYFRRFLTDLFGKYKF